MSEFDKWKEEFDSKFVEKIQISEDEFDVGFKGNVQELYDFIRHNFLPLSTLKQVKDEIINYDEEYISEDVRRAINRMKKKLSDVLTAITKIQEEK